MADDAEAPPCSEARPDDRRPEPPTAATFDGLRRQIGDGIWGWGLEADLPRQARRMRNRLAGRDSEQALRRAVEGRRVLVTGASAGIGQECVRRLGRAGAEVLLVARRADRLQALADELVGGGAPAPHVLPCDLSDLDAVDRLAERVVSEIGGVDVLVNNAGRSIRRPIAEARMHDFERVMQLNYFAVLHLTLPLVADMRRRGRGQVVNLSTLATQFGPQPRFAAYLASKGALEGLARSAAPETRRDGVVWTTVHMPLVRTAMIAPTAVYRRFPAMSVDAAAGMVLDGIVRRSVRVSHPYGTGLGLLDAAAPQTLERLMGSPLARNA